ncbi:MAG TPA: hypothetical protein VHB73_06775 [Alphaproteobacteria bacterium]|nr:hypothetical protein [Alphaproteobacteria bacterium]
MTGYNNPNQNMGGGQRPNEDAQRNKQGQNQNSPGNFQKGSSEGASREQKGNLGQQGRQGV